MLYVRGHPEDYDSWAALTQDEGWSYENVLPAFMKSQSLAEGSLNFHRHLVVVFCEYTRTRVATGT
jgi:choline dehydrogenase